MKTFGKVWLVGAGPGDISLLTLKAMMCIKQADVIIYDRLVNPKILEWALPDCLLINVGKTRASIVYPRMKSMHCLSSMPKLTIILYA